MLNASGHVATRMPREATRAATESDFVQVGAERLKYRGKEHKAEYVGDVRVSDGSPSKLLTIFLKYGSDKQHVIDGLRRISRPGRRTYVPIEGLRHDFLLVRHRVSL